MKPDEFIEYVKTIVVDTADDLRKTGLNHLTFGALEVGGLFEAVEELRFTLQLVETDITTLAAVLLSEPWSRVTTEKMLILSVVEGKDAIDVAKGLVFKNIDNTGQGDTYDPKALREAHSTWNAAVANLSRQLGISDSDLRGLRNGVAGHMRDRTQGLDIHNPWLWHANQGETSQNSIIESPYFKYAVAMADSARRYRVDIIEACVADVMVIQIPAPTKREGKA